MNLDEAIREFKDYLNGKNDFDELDFKEVIKVSFAADMLRMMGDYEYDNFASESKRVKASYRDDLRTELILKLKEWCKS